MATLTTKYNQKDMAFFKYDDKIYCGEIISISATLGVWQREWWVKYDLQTGEDCGGNNIPQEHLFLTREEAEASFPSKPDSKVTKQDKEILKQSFWYFN